MPARFILGMLTFAFFAFLTLLYFLVKDSSKTLLKFTFISLVCSVMLCCVGQILQILLSERLQIAPILFDNITYIGTVFLPLCVFELGYNFAHNNYTFNKKHLILFVIPIVSLIILWTNQHHHLFYVEYSIYIPETVFGPYFTIHSIYSYALLALGLLYLIGSSIKKSGFLSKQSILLLIGTAVPVIANIFATFGIIKSTIYVTPITFSFAIILYIFAIYKFEFLNITPIALKRIVNTMHDGYIVLDNQNVIIDFNNAFLNFFNLSEKDIKGKHWTQLSIINHLFSKNDLLDILEKVKKEEIRGIEKSYNNSYFTIDISPIYKDKSFVGALVFLTDITQHKKDMQTIQDNQQMLIERERLASLGQMVGGIAHSLKTPIFSISGGMEGISDLIKEFDESIEDPNVNNQDMHDIAKDMYVWIEKMKGHLAYMSEVITAVKGQAVNLSGDDSVQFTINELFSHTNILMKHELQNALVTLEVKNTVPDNVILGGNINSLIQVLNNLISNAIQAYNGKLNQKIELAADLQDDKIVIMIKDYGPGLPDVVKDKLFKEMITTKGKEGTGLGLFMSHSMIKAKFNGSMAYETSTNGTTFYINLPV